jgi:TonB family protein
MGRVTNRAVFDGSLLPEGKSRWGSFGAGFGLELIALAAVLIIPLLLPQKLGFVQTHWITPIEAPPIVAWKPQPPPKPEPVKVKQPVVKPPPKVQPVVEVPKPKIYTPVVTTPIAKPKVRNNSSAPPAPEVAKVFPDQTPPPSIGSSAIPTLKKPRESVQTGGFGDPNGLPANNQTNRAPNVAVLGAYDMPAGPGSGNGTGGAKGSKGVVASTGFGNGVAVGSAGGGNRGTVQSSGFGDEHAAAATPKAKQAAAPPATQPVVILYKPKPVYTDEARSKKVEGEVLLSVVFAASGQVEVQRVVQGLGYGLDDSAQAAAREIRFRPAQQEGHAVDSTAIVHIVFELAY